MVIPLLANQDLTPMLIKLQFLTTIMYATDLVCQDEKGRLPVGNVT